MNSAIPNWTVVLSTDAHACRIAGVALQDKGHGHPLPKFGEWDVKNPAASEGFTVIFQKARDGKKTTGPGNVRAGIPPAFRNGGGGGYRPDFKYGDSNQYTPPKRIKVRVCLCTLYDLLDNAHGYYIYTRRGSCVC